MEINNEKENKPVPGIIHSSFWSNIFRPQNELSDLGLTLNSIPIFSFLSKKETHSLINLVHNRNYLAGEYIFYQGDPGIGLYIIREGEVIIQRRMPDNEIISMANFSKGDFFGELALVDGEKRSASAIAKTDARLAVIFKPDLDDYIEKFPKKGIKILEGITQTIASRLRSLNEEHVLSLKTRNSEKIYGT